MKTIIRSKKRGKGLSESLKMISWQICLNKFKKMDPRLIMRWKIKTRMVVIQIWKIVRIS